MALTKKTRKNSLKISTELSLSLIRLSLKRSRRPSKRRKAQKHLDQLRKFSLRKIPRAKRNSGQNQEDPPNKKKKKHRRLASNKGQSAQRSHKKRSTTM